MLIKKQKATKVKKPNTSEYFNSNKEHILIILTLLE